MSTNKPTQPNVTLMEPIKVALTTGPKKCKPFVIEVMVFAPASGFKIEVLIEKSCTPQADAIWKQGAKLELCPFFFGGWRGATAIGAAVAYRKSN